MPVWERSSTMNGCSEIWMIENKQKKYTYNIWTSILATVNHLNCHQFIYAYTEQICGIAHATSAQIE